MGMKSSAGEIVQVQGGHIIRSTGRKDRHSKVYTAKGPRDRRVRLSAHTAIQFYDVQDRLGYDRPSKAVDWLIKKAKSAIDQLAELPPWNPPTNAAAAADTDPAVGSSEMQIANQSESSGYNFQIHRQLGGHPDNHSAFMPPHMDSDAMDDTMKSFFPTNSRASSLNFQNYQTDIISRTTNSTEDLGLSLHSFQDPSLIHVHQSQGNTSHPPANEQTLLLGSPPVGFDANYLRLISWNNDSNTDGNRGSFIFDSPSFLGQGSALSQRGTLQSSFSPSVRAWGDIPMASSDNHKPQLDQQPSIFGSRFLSDGLPAFSIPARLQREEENHSVSSDHMKSPASPDLHR